MPFASEKYWKYLKLGYAHPCQFSEHRAFTNFIRFYLLSLSLSICKSVPFFSPAHSSQGSSEPSPPLDTSEPSGPALRGELRAYQQERDFYKQQYENLKASMAQPHPQASILGSQFLLLLLSLILSVHMKRSIFITGCSSEESRCHEKAIKSSVLLFRRESLFFSVYVKDKYSLLAALVRRVGDAIKKGI